MSEMKLDFSNRPFYLDKDAIKWVSDTLENMTDDEKIGQIFCVAGTEKDDPNTLEAVREIGVGGMMYRTRPASEVRDIHEYVQKNAKIPLLLAANLEAGAVIAKEGTEYGCQMLVSAANDPRGGYRLGQVCCSEAALVGCNWAFAPVVDLDINMRSPATNIRTYGTDPEQVIRMASGYLKAARENGFAASIKHFPGDGVDEHDHHYMTTTNSLSAEKWDATYGRIYKSLIEQDALTLMVGHIALPAWARLLDANADAYAPATLSPVLINKLLRGRLGYKGMTITDSSSMLGLLTYMPREKAIPTAIACGCDMFLFVRNMREDLGFLKKGLADGIVTRARIDEAVSRILAVKAALGLHTRQKLGTLVPDASALSGLGKPEHKAWAKQAAEKAVTLVKDTQNMLPLTSNKYPRLYINVIEDDDNPDSALRQKIKARFEAEGFDVTIRDRQAGSDPAVYIRENYDGVAPLKERYDAVVFFAACKRAPGGITSVRLTWKGFHARGNDSPWFVKEIPTLFISLGNPYHLSDVPMIKTFINAYSQADVVLDAVMDRITGREHFVGVSPVDAFCGRIETHF